MIKAVRITIDLAMPDGVVTQEVRDALDALADTMLVQAEDGLYTAGSPDVDDWGKYDNDGRTSYAAKVDIVNLDTESSASRQHYIDTGVFLTEREVWDDEHADPDRTTDLSGEPL